MSDLYLHEIFKKVNNTRTIDKRVDILKENKSKALITVLRGAFDPTIKFILPPGAPDFEEDDAPEGKTLTRIAHHLNTFPYFIKGGPGESLHPARRERMFLEIIGSVHAEESAIFIAMKDKNLTKKFKNIDRDLVEKAFPGLIKG